MEAPDPTMKEAFSKALPASNKSSVKTVGGYQTSAMEAKQTFKEINSVQAHAPVPSFGMNTAYTLSRHVAKPTVKEALITEARPIGGSHVPANMKFPDMFRSKTDEPMVKDYQGAPTGFKVIADGSDAVDRSKFAVRPDFGDREHVGAYKCSFCKRVHLPPSVKLSTDNQKGKMVLNYSETVAPEYDHEYNTSVFGKQGKDGYQSYKDTGEDIWLMAKMWKQEKDKIIIQNMEFKVVYDICNLCRDEWDFFFTQVDRRQPWAHDTDDIGAGASSGGVGSSSGGVDSTGSSSSTDRPAPKPPPGPYDSQLQEIRDKIDAVNSKIDLLLAEAASDAKMELMLSAAKGAVTEALLGTVLDAALGPSAPS
ncbi:hypothetical protein HK102_009407 [Quaeritorhiza haematococci]|nr:hypothetical protein HK102_009407 [Quaeritorhiza haematococci]